MINKNQFQSPSPAATTSAAPSPTAAPASVTPTLEGSNLLAPLASKTVAEQSQYQDAWVEPTLGNTSTTSAPRLYDQGAAPATGAQDAYADAWSDSLGGGKTPEGADTTTAANPLADNLPATAPTHNDLSANGIPTTSSDAVTYADAWKEPETITIDTVNQNRIPQDKGPALIDPADTSAEKPAEEPPKYETKGPDYGGGWHLLDGGPAELRYRNGGA